MSRQPLHQAILERGVATLEAYLGLATTLIVDLQRGLVTPERASTLMLDAMPENVALSAAIVEEMCDVLLDAIARGGEAPDASPRTGRAGPGARRPGRRRLSESERSSVLTLA